MNRALVKMLVGLAVALGLTLASAPVASAAPTAAEAASAAATAPDCSRQIAANNRAYASYAAADRSVKAAQAKVKKLTKKVKKAKKVHAKKKVKKLTKKLRKAKKSLRAKKEYRSKVAITRTYTARSLARCQSGQAATGSESPIQALCDAGLPQPLCDALANLIPGGSTANPIGLLCAQFPQAAPLCDLVATGLPTDPADLLDIVEGLLVTLGLGDLLDTLLDGLGLGTLGDLLNGTGLDDLLDLLGLGGLLNP